MINGEQTAALIALNGLGGIRGQTGRSPVPRRLAPPGSIIEQGASPLTTTGDAQLPAASAFSTQRPHLKPPYNRSESESLR